MTELLLAHAVLAVLALLVLLFVAFPYRGRAVPRAERLTEKVAEVAERVDPGEAPPLGVLTDPHKSRTMSARFERVEQAIRRTAADLVPGRGADTVDGVDPVDAGGPREVDLRDRERPGVRRA